MVSASLRRFLLPPEKLRFPVAAPLILGSVCVLVVFVTFLAEVLFPFADGLVRLERTHGAAFQGGIRAWRLERGAVGELAWDAARDIDRAVVQRAKDDDDMRNETFRSWMVSKTWWQRLFTADPGFVRGLAETRLKRLSGQAPAWAATARLCEEGASQMQSGARYVRDFHWGMVETARAYSQVLGREIKPAVLLPLVPNGRCE